MGLSWWFSGKDSASNVGAPGDASSILESGRSPEGGHGNRLQCSCLRVPWREEPGGLQSIGSQRTRLACTWRYSISLIIREMPFKTTMRYPLIPIQMVIIKKTKNKCWQGSGEKWTLPCTLLVGMKICTTTVENNTEIPQNIKGRFIIRSNNFTSWYLFKENKNTNKKNVCIAKFITALSTLAKIWKQPKCVLKDEQIKKYVYIHWNIFWP